VEEEYDEGPIADDERPPFADGAITPADPALVQQLVQSAEDDADGDEFRPPAAESDVEEEFDEGPVVDDERPPFDDDEPQTADPTLAKELGVAAVDEEEDEEFAPGAPSNGPALNPTVCGAARTHLSGTR
jgi:hypothetical protein